MLDLTPVHVYQLKVWIQGISPMVWRRLLVRSDSTIADLHYTIQIAIGWSDTHLNRFHIHGKDYGGYHIGGMDFADNPERRYLADFGFRTCERFLYEYDFGDAWLHEVRIEQRLPLHPKRTYPGCINGNHAPPPEDCGGALAYLQGLAPMRRLFRKHLEPLVQAQEIDPRLFQSEMKDRVFVDSIKIGGGFRREAIDGHSPSAVLPLPP